MPAALNTNWVRNDAVASQLVGLADTFPSSLIDDLAKCDVRLQRVTENSETLACHLSEATGAPYMVCRIHLASELCKAVSQGNGDISVDDARTECAQVRDLMSDETLMTPAWDYLVKHGVIVE